MYHLNKNLTLLILTAIFSLNSLSDGRDIFQEASPGIVYIVTNTGSASGVIISNQGHILTNWHAINGANQQDVEAVLHYSYDFDEPKDHFFNIEIVSINKSKDLALLKIINPPSYLKVISISRVIPATGSEAHAIGHPNGEFWTYTKGYISQYRVGYEWQYDEDGIEHTANVYQMQTPIAEGSSGGPLLNKYGNLIGINTFGSKEIQHLNFAVDATEIIKFLAINEKN